MKIAVGKIDCRKELSFIEPILNNSEEARIFKDQLIEHCYRNIEGFRYQLSRKGEPYVIFITIDSDCGIETKLFEAPLSDTSQTLIEEIEFLIAIFKFMSRHLGFRGGNRYKPKAYCS
ncbi:MAG TPA: hypothetical protein VEY70_08795 [Metabacillus sp.]|nr:hypothetical protein [Metabacillus sp.]